MAIAKSIHVSGSSGGKLGYMLGDMLEKDQIAHVVDYNGFRLSRRQIEQIETVPSNEEEKAAHKKDMWSIANGLSRVFDRRAEIADYRVNDPFQEYIVSCVGVGNERERLRRPLTEEERKNYAVDENDCRNLENILISEFLSKIGVHGNITKRLRRKKEGKRYCVVVNEQREAMYIVIGHDGTRHPHFHILTARPDASGKVNDTRNERYRIVKIVKELSEKYDLTLKLEDYEIDIENTNKGYADKIIAGRTILETLSTATTREEFVNHLSEKDITPQWLTHSENGKEYGITFTYVDDKGKKHTYAGGQFDRSLTFGKVNERIKQNLADREAQYKANLLELERQEQEATRIEEELMDKARKNQFWKMYKSQYKPLITDLNESIEATQAMHDSLREQIGECGQAIDNDYHRLSQIKSRIIMARRDIEDANTSKGLITALAGLVAMVNPVAGLLLGVIGRILTEADRRAAYETRKVLYQEARAIHDSVRILKERQTQLRSEDAVIKESLIKDNAAKAELNKEITALKERLTTKTEAYDMDIQKPTPNIEPVQVTPTLAPVAAHKQVMPQSQAQQERQKIRITQENAATIKLPPGYEIIQVSGKPVLCTPNAGNYEIAPKKNYDLYEQNPGSGIYSAPYILLQANDNAPKSDQKPNQKSSKKKVLKP